MNKTTILIKNTFYLLIADIFTPLLSFFLVIYISRMLGTEGMGEYATVLTFVSFFEIIAVLGLSDMIIRGISVDTSQSNAYLTV